MSTAQASSPARSRHSPEYHYLDTEINSCLWDTTQHVALHPRFSERDELDKQFEKSTGWVPMNGCSTRKPWKIETRTSGTNGCNVCARDSIPDRDQVPYLRDQLAHRDAHWNMLDQNEIFILFKKKNNLHMCVYSAAKQKIGNPEWSMKRNKYYFENPQKQHKGPMKYTKPWTNSFKPDGEKQRLNSGTCMSPTALERNSLQLTCSEFVVAYLVTVWRFVPPIASVAHLHYGAAGVPVHFSAGPTRENKKCKDSRTNQKPSQITSRPNASSKYLRRLPTKQRFMPCSRTPEYGREVGVTGQLFSKNGQHRCSKAHRWEILLNTTGSCGSPSRILLSQLVTSMRPTTGGAQTPSGAPVSYGPPSPQTQCYQLDTSRPHRQARPFRGNPLS